WLVFSLDSDNDVFRLLQYGIDGTKLGEVKDESGQAVVNSIIEGASLQPFPGGVFADGSQLVVLEQEEAGGGTIHKVIYKFSHGASGQPGSLKKLRNGAGKALKLPTSRILLDRVAIAHNAVYMAMDTSGNNEGNSIYRLDQNGWEEL